MEEEELKEFKLKAPQGGCSLLPLLTILGQTMEKSQDSSLIADLLVLTYKGEGGQPFSVSNPLPTAILVNPSKLARIFMTVR